MLKAIIIDDEVHCRENLQAKIEATKNNIQICAVCRNGEEGLAAIQANNPDVVFLDIEMPGMNGFTMLQQLPSINFEVIFTTAYNQFAIKAIRFSAFDYLLKPIDTDDLNAAISRLLSQNKPDDREQKKHFLQAALSGGKINKIALPTLEGLVFVDIDEIIRLQSVSNYTHFFLNNKKKVIVSKTMGEYEMALSSSNFIRVHHSHMVNMQHIKKYIKGSGGQLILSDESVVDVSKRKKDEVLLRMQQVLK